MLKYLIQRLKEEKYKTKKNQNIDNNIYKPLKILNNKPLQDLQFLTLEIIKNISSSKLIKPIDTPLPCVYCIKDWIDEYQETIILKNIEISSYRNIYLNGRKTQVWGGDVTQDGIINKEELPEWIELLIKSLVDTHLFDNSTRPNHILINQYDIDRGILPHKDGPLYYPKVAILSLGSDVVFDFWEPLTTSKLSIMNNKPMELSSKNCLFSVFIPRRSLLVFTDKCYTDLLHGIQDSCEDVLDNDNIYGIDKELKGKIIKRYFRTSLTFRYIGKNQS
ncbi:hypothetical protein ACR3K2_28510 [Cryptosporidium serpentis]